jgi:hypothetical protein
MSSRATEAKPFTLFQDIPSEKNPKTGMSRRRTMRFDINALADFEQETGMGFGQLMGSKALFATARALIWAGFRHEDKLITVEQCGAKVQEYLQQGGDIGELLGHVFEIAKSQGAFGRETPGPEYVQPALEDGATIQGEAVAVATEDTVPHGETAQ